MGIVRPCVGKFGMYVFILSSNPIVFFSTSCITAADVNCLVSDPMRNTVVGVTST